MRPKVFTVKNLLLLAAAVAIFAGLVSWLRGGGRLPWAGVPPTAGKVAFVSTRGSGGDADVYVMDGETGANATPLGADEKGDDREPAWSADGAEVVFTSDRGGVVRQVYQTRVEANARLLQRTSTSGTKEAPQFRGSRDIYFLDAGKVTRVASDASDSSAVFPTLEQKRQPDGPLAGMFTGGGLARFSVSPDGEKIAAVLQQEGGQVLVVYFPQSKQLAALGVARSIDCAFSRSGDLVALFVGGTEEQAPLPQAAGLYDPASMSPEMLAVYKVPRLLGSAPLGRDNSENPEAGLFFFPPDEGGISRVVRFDGDLKPVGGAALPSEPTSMGTAPDASRVAVAVAEGKDAGLYIVPLTEGAQGGKIFPKAAEHPAFSPDGARIAFASEGDIYTVTVEGGEPVNLTKGEGSNSRPVWSPQAPKAK